MNRHKQQYVGQLLRHLYEFMFVLCLLPATIYAQSDGGTQSPFVLGTGAREQAMGRAAVALSRNSETVFWNPARLTLLQRPELSLYRSQLFVDGSLYHTGFMAYPTLDFGVFGIGYQRIDVSDIERRDDRNLLTGSFSNSESNLLLGYGRRFGPLLSLGATLRIAQQSVENFSDAALGLDLGMALQTSVGNRGLHSLSLGANIQNAIEPRLRLLEDEVKDPRSLRMGVGYEGGTATRNLLWVAGVDLIFANKVDWNGGLGGELTYAEVLSMRLGLDQGNPTFGMGIHWQHVRFDYALRTDDILPRNDRFTLAVNFGTSVGERRRERRRAQNQQVSEELANLLREREAAELRRALEAANTAYSLQQWNEALRLYRRVLALNPAHEHATQQQASIELEQKLRAAETVLRNDQPAQAAALYQGILGDWPTELRALRGLQQARTSLQTSARRDQSLRELFKEALRQFTLDNLTESNASLRELLRLDPIHELGLDLQQRIAETIGVRGETALKVAQQHAAERRLDAALRKLAEARRFLGSRADLDSLEAAWGQQRIAARQRDLQMATSKRARLGGSRREDTTPRAPRSLTAEQRRDLQNRYQDGLAAFSRGDFDDAIRNWRSVWFEDPHLENVSNYLIKAYLFQGVELYGLGRYEDALDRCRRVLEIDPANEKAIRYLDRIKEEQIEIEEIERRKANE